MTNILLMAIVLQRFLSKKTPVIPGFFVSGEWPF